MKTAVHSQGFDADVHAVNQDHAVVLHQWHDGMLLVIMFDDQMPAFTSKPIPHGAPLSIIGKDAMTSTTGYVFWIAEPSEQGFLEFENRRYDLVEIYDYVLWTHDAEVRARYDTVLARAKAED